MSDTDFDGPSAVAQALEESLKESAQIPGSNFPTTAHEESGRPAHPPETSDQTRLLDQEHDPGGGMETQPQSYQSEHPEHFDPYQRSEELHAEWREPQVSETQLNAPEALPNMAQRWIRMNLLDETDAPNATRAFQQGWRPRTTDDMSPEDLEMFIPVKTTLGHVIMVNDLVLCHRPMQIHLAEIERQQQKTRGQMAALKHDLATDNQALVRMGGKPIKRDEEVSVSFQAPRRPVVQEDE